MLIAWLFCSQDFCKICIYKRLIVNNFIKIQDKKNDLDIPVTTAVNSNKYGTNWNSLDIPSEHFSLKDGKYC